MQRSARSFDRWLHHSSSSILVGDLLCAGEGAEGVTRLDCNREAAQEALERSCPSGSALKPEAFGSLSELKGGISLGPLERQFLIRFSLEKHYSYRINGLLFKLVVI